MATAPNPSATESGSGHILLVEDDVTFGETIVRLLEGAGYHVSLASDFRRALELLESKESIDLLISDIVMPASVNGIALSRMARMRRRDLKIIYVTGYDLPGITREALGPILRKPVDSSDLLREIAAVLAS
jgi:CheY-like chemotaxis protein